MGERIYLIGDSLSAGTQAPGYLLGSLLQGVGNSVQVDATGGWAISYFRGVKSVFKNPSVFRFQASEPPRGAIRRTILAGHPIAQVAGDIIRSAQAFAPSRVLLMLGTNDYEQSEKAIRGGLQALLGAFGSRLFGLGPPFFAPDIKDGAINTGAARVSSVMVDVLKENYLDTRPLSGGLTGKKFRTDGIHFTTLGAGLYAQNLFNALRGTQQRPGKRSEDPLTFLFVLSLLASILVPLFEKRK